MSLIHNERTKLLATGLNNIAVATIVTAIVAPVAGFLYGSPTAAATKWWPLIGIIWLFVGATIHLAAQFFLGKLRP